jgi:hypothetical protein
MRDDSSLLPQPFSVSSQKVFDEPERPIEVMVGTDLTAQLTIAQRD